MTLILTCLTPQYVVQASDRRLTLPNGKLFEERENKATMLCRHATFAYTGLADMGVREKTHELLLRSIASEQTPSFNSMIEKLRANATKAVRSLALGSVPSRDRNAVRRTAFVGAGFLQPEVDEQPDNNESDDGLYRFICIVSNAQTLADGWKPEASRDFSIDLNFLPASRGIGLHVTGQELLPEEQKDLFRLLRSLVRRGVTPNAVARALARAVRSVSTRNGAVGADVMCTIVRRADAINRTFDGKIDGPAVPIVAEGFNEAQYFKVMKGEYRPLWIYSPADPTNPLHYTPNFTCGGVQMSGGLMGPQSMVEAAERELEGPNTRRRRR